jgi:RNA polymerase sigma factor (sigma-70 family)
LAKNQQGALRQGIQTLYNVGTLGALTDGELLDLFTDRRDETAELAFATLVERHGAMVLRVCRSLLRDEHDAQDAFQATFLILVRRAGAIRERESVGSWLYGVSLRVSACAKIAASRRRRHERLTAQFVSNRYGDEAESRELFAIIHDELRRLPDRYRAAIVLCYLEGLTCEAAARRLGWPVGTVKSRLARGRQQLSHRLVRRGLGSDEPSTSRTSTSSLVPLPLPRGTVLAMLRFGAERSTGGLVSETAISWALSTLKSMQMARLVMITAAVFVGLSALGAVVLAAHKPRSVQSSGPATTVTRDREPEKPIVPTRKAGLATVRVVNQKGEGVPNAAVHVVELGSPRKDRDLTGRVFDQHGLPIAAARVTYNRETLVSGATDRMGLFRLKGLPPGPFVLAVDKNGYTPGWATIPSEALEVELTLPSYPDSKE